MPENEVVVLIDERELVDDEYVKRVVALAVPESGTFPDGIKYRIHYETLSEDTVLRYDDSHGTHECHSGGTVQEIPFSRPRTPLPALRSADRRQTSI